MPAVGHAVGPSNMQDDQANIFIRQNLNRFVDRGQITRKVRPRKLSGDLR